MNGEFHGVRVVLGLDVVEGAQSAPAGEQDIDVFDDLLKAEARIFLTPELRPVIEVEEDRNTCFLAVLMAEMVSALGPGPTAGVMPQMWSAAAPLRISGQLNVPGCSLAKAELARS